MSFRLPDKWVWDFWFARHEGQHHIFYLQAPRALGDPGLRHHQCNHRPRGVARTSGTGASCLTSFTRARR